jgi:hypothetical protein
LSARAKTGHLLCTLLEGGAIGLLRCQANALLLLGRSKSLLVALLKDWSDSLGCCQVLLTGQVCPLKASTVPAKGA